METHDRTYFILTESVRYLVRLFVLTVLFQLIEPLLEKIL